MKGLLFYWFRGGSTLIQNLLRDQTKKIQDPESYKLSRNCQFLVTSPAYKCLFEDAYALRSPQLQLVEEMPSEHVIWRAHIGDEVLIPPNLIKLFSPSNKIVMLVRDGRNQIESMRKYKGGYAAQQFATDPEETFIKKVKGFVRRAKFAEFLTEEFGDNFKLIRMERVVENPMDSLLDLYKFWNLKPNKKKLLRNIKNSFPKKNQVLNHSSFGTLNNLNNRYSSWTQKEVDIFNRIAGSSLVSLGYE